MRTWMMMTTVIWIGGMAGGTMGASEYLSPQDVVASADGKLLYLSLATADAVGVFDIASGKLIKTIPVAGTPSGLALDDKSNRMYVAIAKVAGTVCVIDLATGTIAGTISVGHTPVAMALSADGKMLYVCNRFGTSVSIVDLADKKTTATVAVLREPTAAALTADGKWLFVCNLLPVGPADGDITAAAISVIDTTARKVTKEIRLPNGSTTVRGIAFSPDGKYGYASHILARYQLPTTQLERGWMNTNAVSVIDVAGQSLVNTVLVDEVDLGGANPWAVACSGDGKYVCVTHAGTHELSIIDRAGLHDRLGKAAAGQKVTDATSSGEEVPNDLAFLVDLRKRIKLSGNGPRGVALVGNKAWVTEYFSDSIAMVDLESAKRIGTPSIPLQEPRPITTVRKGEIFFHDAELCFQHWQSCASCHPGEARADGLNWDLLNDGIGNPKSTKSMLMAHQTPPAMISGVRGNAEAAVRAGIRGIQFAVRPDEDAVAIDEYLKLLKPVASPHLVNGQLSAKAKRGQGLFEKAGCAVCHPGPLFTNLKEYNIGTGKGREVDVTFDTPTLVEVWRTAPYLHDGRAATIQDMLTTFNKEDKHGKTSGLSAEEIDDLAEYVMSL
ncbi:MAG: c-type cytochrome [Phycisphaerae bacterium]|nr:c-type cytochrome [Phycisphaerae bacterium]